MKAFYFIVVVLMCACHKEYSCENCNQSPPPVNTPPGEQPEPPTDEPPQQTDPLEEVYATFLADENAIYIQSSLPGIQATRSAWINGPSYCLDGFFLTGIGNSSEKPYFSLMKNAQSVSTLQEAKSVFALGKYSFLTLLSDPIDCCPCRDFSDGVALNFIDSAGIFWATYLGNQPPDAGFEIQGQKEYKSKLYIEAGFGGAFFNEHGEKRIIYGSLRLVVWE